MKKAILCFALFIGRALTAQTFTQVTTVPYDGMYRSKLTINLPVKTTSPCTMILVGTGDVQPTITDDQSDVWETVNDLNGTPIGGIWYAQCKGAASIVTLIFGSPSRFYGVIGEKSGWYDADVCAQLATGNSNPAVSNTIITKSADLIIGYGWNPSYTSPNINAGAGYVMEGQAGVFLEDLHQSAPGPVFSAVTYLRQDGASPIYTTDARYYNGWSGWWVQGVVAFKPAIPDFCICNH